MDSHAICSAFVEATHAWLAWAIEHVPILSSVLIAAWVLFKFYAEYKRDFARRRGELYDKLREKFNSNEFDDILTALDNYARAGEDNKEKFAFELKRIDVNRRMRFAALVEYVALLAQSGVFDYKLASYEFGFHSIQCWESDPFWDGLCSAEDKNREADPYWALYALFVKRLKSEKIVASKLKI